MADLDESKPLTADYKAETASTRTSLDTDSISSIILENLSGLPPRVGKPYTDRYVPRGEFSDVEDVPGGGDDTEKYFGHRPIDRKARKFLWIVCILCLLGWGIAAAQFVAKGGYKEAKSPRPHDPAATQTVRSGHKITMDQVLGGVWRARRHAIRWISGPEGQDGMLLQRGGEAKGGYLVVDDVRSRNTETASANRKILMSKGVFNVGGQNIFPSETWPNAKLRKVLVLSNRESNWRHSFTGNYWIFDVNTQKGEPLDPLNVDGKVQLAKWSPKGDAIAFVRDNNLYLRRLDDKKAVVQITKDGGPELFYGVPDWVYEEEVFSGNSATWWSEDGKYIAFLRTNETMVPTYPVQYFLSRPSGKQPKPGEENYPEVRDIKYPKAGAPNPIVEIQFYDVEKDKVFTVKIEGEFEDHDRIINEVFWAGTEGKVMFKQTNRVSDHLKVVLVDAERRTGRTVREKNIKDVDGGWFEVSEKTTYVPPDPVNGRPHAGYVDSVIYKGFDHLAYFTPLDNPEPIMLTSGDWEVVNAPSAVDLKHNWVYFIATKESSIQRHAYRVKLDGSMLIAITDTKTEGYYTASFSSGAGFVLLDYEGPNVPWQKVMTVPSSTEPYAETIEDNAGLKDLASKHELPLLTYGTIPIAGFDLNYVERRPPHFNPKTRHPVLFWMYQGPGSQSVDKKFNIDFQAYVAASLGYIVVTVDGRGTGFKGRDVRCVIRGNIGFYESEDQIAAAKIWAAKSYVDPERMAIWGWSYGGFMTLKTLERDAGRTFKYGMAVAPVTDWRYYDSVYTERYMFTPQTNGAGYDNTSISDVRSLGQNVRFLVMHGVADDNVHTQSTYTLIDKLDLGGVENYDVHVFPDSDHGIYFHNANRIVYDKLQNWLINAFNGEWLRTDHPKPIIDLDAKEKTKRDAENALAEVSLIAKREAAYALHSNNIVVKQMEKADFVKRSTSMFV